MEIKKGSRVNAIRDGNNFKKNTKGTVVRLEGIDSEFYLHVRLDNGMQVGPSLEDYWEAFETDGMMVRSFRHDGKFYRHVIYSMDNDRIELMDEENEVLLTYTSSCGVLDKNFNQYGGIHMRDFVFVTEANVWMPVNEAEAQYPLPNGGVPRKSESCWVFQRNVNNVLFSLKLNPTKEVEGLLDGEVAISKLYLNELKQKALLEQSNLFHRNSQLGAKPELKSNLYAVDNKPEDPVKDALE